MAASVSTSCISAGCRAGKSVRCSSEPDMGLVNVPKFCTHNLINILNVMIKIVFKKANKEKLRMIWFPKIYQDLPGSQFFPGLAGCNMLCVF